MNIPRRAFDDQIDVTLGDARAVALVIPKRMRTDPVKTRGGG
jgi:hypothetical protein